MLKSLEEIIEIIFESPLLGFLSSNGIIEIWCDAGGVRRSYCSRCPIGFECRYHTRSKLSKLLTEKMKEDHLHPEVFV